MGRAEADRQSGEGRGLARPPLGSASWQVHFPPVNVAKRRPRRAPVRTE